MISALPKLSILRIAGVVAAFAIAALWFAFQFTDIYAHRSGHEENAVVESCRPSRERVTTGDLVEVTITVRNKSAGFASAKLFGTARWYDSNGNDLGDSYTETKTVVRGQTHTFSRKPGAYPGIAGTYTIECAVWWDDDGNRREQHHTGMDGAPANAIVEVRNPPEAPTPVPPPAPSFQIRSSVSTSRIELGETVEIEVQIHDVGGSGDRGGITVSFPELSRASTGVRNYRYTAGNSYVLARSRGETIWDSDYEQFTADYLLVETDHSPWSRSSNPRLSLVVRPEKAGEFPIYVRGWICSDEYQSCERRPRPGYGQATDQQGFSVEVHTVTVSEPEEPDLIVREVTVNGDESPSDYTVGDTVKIRALVENVGGGAARGSSLRYYLGNDEIGRDDVSSLDPDDDTRETLDYEFQDSDVGSHKIRVVIDSDDEVDEASESNNEYSTRGFRVDKPILPPDLVVTNVTVNGNPSPPDFTVGARVEIQAVVRNRGDGPADNSAVAFYLGSERIGSKNVSSLDPGESSSQSTRYTFTGDDVGSQSVRAVADSDREVNEADDDNNESSTRAFQVREPEPKYPDLEFASVTFNGSSSPSDFTVGDKVEIRAIVKNGGDAASGNSVLAAYLNNKAIGEQQVGSLVVGRSSSTLTIPYTFTGTDVGSRSITLRIDARKQVREKDEYDNEASTRNFQVRALPPKYPDLEFATGATFNGSSSPSDFTVDDKVEIQAVVRNGGDAASGNSVLEVYLDDKVIGRAEVTSLAPGESSPTLIIPYTFTGADVGSHSITLGIDARKQVRESDEYDNESSTRNFQVRPLPPEPPEFYLHSTRTKVSVGEKATVSVTIRNRVNKPELTAVLQVTVPSGWGVTGEGFDNDCSGQCSATYRIATADKKDIEVHVTPNEAGNDYKFYGQVEWYYAGDEGNAQVVTDDPVEINVSAPPKPITPTPPTPPEPDGPCSRPAEPSMRLTDLAAPMSALGLIVFALIRRRRR